MPFQKSIRFSELLQNIPSDEDLKKILPHALREGKSAVTRFGLEVLRLRLEGFSQLQIAEKLQVTKGCVSYWSSLTKNSLSGNLPDWIEVDIPALQRLLHLDLVITDGPQKLSQLLQAMPSDEELLQLYRERGHPDTNSRRHRIDHNDLYILRQRLAGRSFESIGEELGVCREQVQRQIHLVRNGLVRDLKIELDVPALFKPYKPSHRVISAPKN